MTTRFLLQRVLFAVACALLLAPCFAPRTAAASEAKAKLISDDECREFAEKLEKAVLEQEVDTFSQLIDWDRLVDRAASGFPGNRAVDQLRAALKKSTRANATNPAGFCAQIVGLAGQGANYRNIRVHREQDGQHCRFRLVMPGGAGVNYHDYILARGPNGRPVATDVFITASGELLSNIFRRAFAPSIGEALQGLEQPAGSDQILHAGEMLEMAVAVGQKRYASALQIYRALPVGLQQEKNVLLLRMRAAQAIDSDEYQSCLDDYRKFHPNDVALDLLLIDYYVLKQDYALALQAVDAVDKSIDGDPQLNVVRANILYVDKQLPAAREAAEKAIETEPSLLPAHWVLISVSLAQKDFKTTLAALQRIKATFPIEFGELARVPEYAEFVDSPQYVEWLLTPDPKPAEESATESTAAIPGNR